VASENEARLRESLVALNRGDFETWAQIFDPEILFEPHRASIHGAYHGLEGIRDWIADTRESFALFEVELTEIRDLDDERLLGIGILRLRGQESGIETEVVVAAIFEFRDGRLFRYKDYGDRRLALEAARLAE
jgi:ketosteroid isomerase-like protein